VVKLAGQLITRHLPNQSGWWAYRKLSNGEVLEVKLTKKEWFRLHERHQEKELAKIRALEKHPLNLAARTILQKAHEFPLSNEICLISLARFTFAENSPTWDDVMVVLNDWGRSSGTMQKAIWVLEEDEVTPDDLLSCNLVDAARLIWRHLTE
jgi:hypothetical protein